MSTRFKFRMKKSNFRKEWVHKFRKEWVHKFRKEFVSNVTSFFGVFNSLNDVTQKMQNFSRSRIKDKKAYYRPKLNQKHFKLVYKL